MTRTKSSQSGDKTINGAQPVPKVTRKRAALGDVSNHAAGLSTGQNGVNGKATTKPSISARQRQSSAPYKVDTQAAVLQERRKPLVPVTNIPSLKKVETIIEEPPTKLRRTLPPVAEAENLTYGTQAAVKASSPPPVVELVQDYDDLDVVDMDDPLMVSEYVVEIFDYLREQELLTLPVPDYMDRQKELHWKMRGILIDWLVEVHQKFRLLPETLFLAVNIIDRFLSLRVCALPKLQLVGITALFIAAKYEEVMCPSITNFIYMADGGYKDDEILKAEQYVRYFSCRHSTED